MPEQLHAAHLQGPPKVTLSAFINKYTFHGRLTVVSPVNFLTSSFGVELVDGTGTHVIYRATIPAGSFIASPRVGQVSYLNVLAKTNGGLYKVNIKDQGIFYKITALGYGNLLGSEADMAARVFAGLSEWTVDGTWIQKSPEVWKFIPAS